MRRPHNVKPATVRRSNDSDQRHATTPTCILLHPPSPHHLLPSGRSTSFPATGSARTRRCELTTGSPWPNWSTQGPVPICRPTRQRQLSSASVAESLGGETRWFPLDSTLYIYVAARAPPVLPKKPARLRWGTEGWAIDGARGGGEELSRLSGVETETGKRGWLQIKGSTT